MLAANIAAQGLDAVRVLHNGRQAFLERRLLLAGILPAANIAAQKIDGLRVLHNGIQVAIDKLPCAVIDLNLLAQGIDGLRFLHNGKQVLFDGTVAFIAGNLALLSAA